MTEGRSKKKGRQSKKRKDRKSKDRTKKSRKSRRDRGKASKRKSDKLYCTVPRPVMPLGNASFRSDSEEKTIVLLNDPMVNPMQAIEKAAGMVERMAKLKPAEKIRGGTHRYRVIKELEARPFGFTYEVIQMKTGNKFRLKTEVHTGDPDMQTFKALRVIVLLKSTSFLGRT